MAKQKSLLQLILWAVLISIFFAFGCVSTTHAMDKKSLSNAQASWLPTLDQLKLINQAMSWLTGVILLACLILVLAYEFKSPKK